MKPREKTLKIKGTGREKGKTLAWGRGGKVLFFSPPKTTTWGGGFGVRFEFDNPVLGFFITPREARQLAEELVRRAADIEERS